MAVYVLGKHKTPLMPCTERRARLLLERGRARIHRMFPFTIRLIDRENGSIQPLILKLDPGSKQTGIAIIRENESTAHVVSLIELKHRGAAISKSLKQRASFRRRRRSANLRYRAPRFDNRRRPEGWIAPSLQHRVNTVISTVARLRNVAPITSIIQELVRFDMQLISGVEYQNGTLVGYELREYLLEKWGRQCAYCDKKDAPLNLDHVHPKAKGGSNRLSNLALACIPCNQKKGSKTIEAFLSNDPARLERIKRQLKRPLADAAAVNTTRWALFNALAASGLPVTTGSGGRTKYNRHRLSIPKSHALDAVCAGNMDLIGSIDGSQQPTLLVTANGRGAYKRTRLTANGFPRGYLMRSKSVHGFTTGDMVRAVVPSGKKQGNYVARVAIRASGSFNLQLESSVVQSVSHKYCRCLQRGNGFGYTLIAPTRKEDENRGRAPRAVLFLPGLNAEVSRNI